MTAQGRCRHPKDQLTKVSGDRHVSCGACGSSFVPRGSRVKHGTYEGYGRHQAKRARGWSWPPCEKCAEAARMYRLEYDRQPEPKRRRQRRETARRRALERLRMSFPGSYFTLYEQELEALDSQVSDRTRYWLERQAPAWDDIVARLVKEALGADEPSVTEKVRGRLATQHEREVMRLVTRLRVLLEGYSAAAKAKPGHSGE